MVQISYYPRVLIVMMSKIKAADPCNLLIRMQFGEWPKNNLAQIHASADPDGQGEFCGQYYRLQCSDRYFGALFHRMRAGVFDMVVMNTVQEHDSARSNNRFRKVFDFINKRFGDWLIRYGLWEMIFRVRLSTQIEKFVKEFKPDIIYCQGYSLGFISLPMLIAQRFKIPICYQTTDDWPSYTCKGFPMSWFLRRSTQQLISKASLRMAFGEKMQRLYESRYGEDFDVTYHLDDPQRFLVNYDVKTDLAFDSKQYRIVYTGSLALRRYEALQDLLVAVRLLLNINLKIQIDVYCSGLPKDLPKELLDASEVVFLPLPSHDNLPRILSTASILFLPESFSVAPELIEYAISSKAHLYMLSGKPILVYGPPCSGTVDYAKTAGWGCVITERSTLMLRDIIVEMFMEEEWIQQLRANAEKCIHRHHDLYTGQQHFHRRLSSVVN